MTSNNDSNKKLALELLDDINNIIVSYDNKEISARQAMFCIDECVESIRVIIMED